MCLKHECNRDRVMEKETETKRMRLMYIGY